MSNHSIIEHRANYHYVKLEEDYTLLCTFGKQYPHCKAFILSVLEHWGNDKVSKGQDLYVYMTYPQWIDAMYGLFRRNTIIASLAELEEEHLILKRPLRYHGKNTFEYAINASEVQTRLKELPERTEKYTRPNINAFKFKRVQIQTADEALPIQIQTGDAFKFKHNVDSLTQIPTNIDSRDTGVSTSVPTPPAMSLSSSHEKIPIATPAPQPTENESYSHDEMVADGVAMATGNTTKGHTYDHTTHSLIDASRDSGLSLRHSQGAIGDTRGTPPTELPPRDETHQEESQTPGHVPQGVTKGHAADAAPAADTAVCRPLDDHRAVSGAHPSDAATALEGQNAHEPALASPAPLWPPAVVVAAVPVGPRPQDAAAQVARSRKPATPRPEPTCDELAFKRRCDALQAHINDDWRGYALTERGPIINERMVIKKLVAAYTDTQCAQIWEYLFTRHFKFSKPDYRYTIGAQIMWEQAKNVAQILRGEKANHGVPVEPPRSTFVPRPSTIVVPDDWAAAYKAANGGN